MAKVLVQVTREDLEQGRPVDAHLCPVACAIKRALGLDPNGAGVHVDGTHWHRYSDGSRRDRANRRRLPDNVIKKIAQIDRNSFNHRVRVSADVQPFKFEIELP